MSPAQRNINGYPLPTVINPPRRCIKFHIPDEPAHRRAFLGAISELSKWFNWQRDEDKLATQVAAVWRDVFAEVIAAFANPCDCPEPDNLLTCGSIIYPDNPAIEWIHSNPFIPNDCEPYWDCTPFNVVKNAYGFIPVGSVVTTVADYLKGLDVSEDLPPIIEDPLGVAYRTAHPPGFKVRVSGAGTIQLYMVRVPQGGLCWFIPDGNPINSRIEDMSTVNVGQFDTWLNAIGALTLRPSVSGFFGTRIIEFTFNDPGEHTLEVLFLPKLGLPNIAETGWGGGLEKIRLCNLDTVRGVRKPPIKEENGEIYIYHNNIWVLLDVYLNQFVSNHNCDCNCDELGDEDMCNCDGAVRFDYCGSGKLQYKKNGVWTDLVVGEVEGQPTAPVDEVPVSDNACFKANGVWSLIEATMEALLDSVGQNPILDYSYFQSHHPEINENNTMLASFMGDYGGSNIAAGTVTHWNANKATIKANVICQLQDSFSKSSVLDDTEFNIVRSLDIDTGSNQLNAVIEAAIDVPEKVQYKQYANMAVIAQAGDCDCLDGLPIDRNASSPSSPDLMWTHVFNFKAQASTLGFTPYIAGFPVLTANANGMTGGVHDEPASDASYFIISSQKTLPYADTTTRITKVQTYWSALATGNNTQAGTPNTRAWIVNSGGTLKAGMAAVSAIPVLTPASYEAVMSEVALVNTDLLRVILVVAQRSALPLVTGASGYIEKIAVTGYGKNPFIA